jgi:hypothetical protein
VRTSHVDFLIRFCMHAASLQHDLHCLYSSADHWIFSSSIFHKFSDVIYSDIISSVVPAEQIIIDLEDASSKLGTDGYFS